MSRWNKVIDKLRELAAWWIDELIDLLPAQMKPRSETLVTYFRIVQDSDRLSFDFVSPESTERLAECSNAPGELAQTLKDLRAANTKYASLPVRYELNPPLFMFWERTRPGTAARHLIELAKIDLLADAPLGQDKVAVAVETISTSGDGIETRDYAVKQSHLDAIQRLFRDAGAKPDQIGPLDTSVDFQNTQARFANSPLQGLRNGAVVLAIAGALVLGGVWLRQARVLDLLTTEMEILQASVTKERANQGDIERQYSIYKELTERRQGYSSVAENWETLSNLLPNNAWVTELSIEGNQIRLVGFADQAAPLVNTIEAHPSFSAVRLTSPIALDARRNAERFSLELTSQTEPTPGEIP